MYKSCKRLLGAGVLTLCLLLSLIPSAAAVDGTDSATIYNRFCYIHALFTGVSHSFDENTNVPDATAHYYPQMMGLYRDYQDELGQCTLSYSEYIAILDGLFLNHSDMKSYLTENGWYDAETDTVSFFLGGVGDSIYFQLLSTYQEGNKLYLQGLYLDMAGDTSGEEYVDWYEITNPDGSKSKGEILGAKELVLTQEDGTYKISAYRDMDYYIVNDTLYADGAIYYPLTIEYYQVNADGTATLSNADGVYFESGGGKYFPRTNANWWLPATGDQGYSCNVVADRYINPDSLAVDIVKVLYGPTGGAEDSFQAMKILEISMPDGTVPNFRLDDYIAAGPTTIRIYKQLVDVKIDSENGASVTIPGGSSSYYENVEFKVDAAAEEDAAAAVKLVQKELGQDTKTAVYDIRLEKDGVVCQPAEGDTVTVTLPIPEGWDAARMVVYRAEADGTLTDLNCTVSADGKTVSFNTTHFSTYVLAQKSVTSPETGDSSQLLLWTVLLLAGGMALTGVVCTRRAKR